MKFRENHQCPLRTVGFSDTLREQFVFSCAAVLLQNFFHLDSRITKASRRLNCVLQLHNVFAQIFLLLFNFNQLTHLNALYSNPIEMKHSGDVRMNHFSIRV